MAEIKFFKLSTGDDILGEIIGSEGTNIVLRNVVQMVVVPSQSGKEHSFGFAPYPHYAQPKSNVPIEVNVMQIVFNTDPDQQILEQYNAVFGNIITQPSNIILK